MPSTLQLIFGEALENVCPEVFQQKLSKKNQWRRKTITFCCGDSVLKLLNLHVPILVNLLSLPLTHVIISIQSTVLFDLQNGFITFGCIIYNCYYKFTAANLLIPSCQQSFLVWACTPTTAIIDCSVLTMSLLGFSKLTRIGTWRATQKQVRYVTFFRECWGWGGKPAPMTLKIGTEWFHG